MTYQNVNVAEEPPKGEKPKPIDFDTEKVAELLSIVLDTKDMQPLLPLNQAATVNLMIIAAEVREEMDKRAEEARKKSEADTSAKEAEARKKEKAA